MSIASDQIGHRTLGFVNCYKQFPNVFDAFKSSTGHGKLHGPTELGRFTNIDDAKKAVEDRVRADNAPVQPSGISG